MAGAAEKERKKDRERERSQSSRRYHSLCGSLSSAAVIIFFFMNEFNSSGFCLSRPSFPSLPLFLFLSPFLFFFQSHGRFVIVSEVNSPIAALTFINVRENSLFIIRRNDRELAFLRKLAREMLSTCKIAAYL